MMQCPWKPDCLPLQGSSCARFSDDLHDQQVLIALFQDAEGCMRLFVWHRDQKAVSHCLTAILNRAQNVNTDSSS